MENLVSARCRLGVSFGPESDLYSFPGGHPLNRFRALSFAESLSRMAAQAEDAITILRPRLAGVEDLRLFHTTDYIESVRLISESGEGYLDYPDTPAFQGVYEAASYTVGGTLQGLDLILQQRLDHFFNPIGGLHHAARERASGFCVFNDAAIAIAHGLKLDGLQRIAYVDIDAHHGDGVYYGFESDPRVTIVDIHEDGRSLFPGTGGADEKGKGEAAGTKLNLPLPAGSGDSEFIAAFNAAEGFIAEARPEFIFLQCGADGLRGDPLTHLRYSPACHAYAAKELHRLAHKQCGGRILAMGGGGYDAANVDAAWSAVVRELASCRTS